ncbi:hypothetical protein FACS1894158_04960 [Betaproteobacteria bacterium]|nr:hypothetical protein FACS1894158_04960 [Betaproteobacteria bacterium]
MIKMLTAYTTELDDVDAAVSEILGQLDLEHNLLCNSVGIMSFYSEFLETGVVKALSDALPFDVIGGTTSNVAVPGAIGDIMLALTVLTSDDARFAAGASAPLHDDAREPVTELYSRINLSSSGKPALLLVYAPVVSNNINGDDLIEALDAVSGGVPVFGTLAFTHLSDFSGIYTCFNGEQYADCMSVIAIYGDVKPEFLRTPTPEVQMIPHKTTITRAVRNEILEMNGQPAIDYLQSIGIIGHGSAAGIVSIPFVVTLRDGSRVVRSPYKILDNGHLLFNGAVPEGSHVGFSNFEMDFVIASAGKILMAAIKKARPNNAMLLFSCVARKWALGAQFHAEMEKIDGCLNGTRKYQLAYSGGEICPARNDKGELVNRFHNYTLIGCLL